MLRWREVALTILGVGFVWYLFLVPQARQTAIETGLHHEVEALARSFGPAGKALKRLVHDATAW